MSIKKIERSDANAGDELGGPETPSGLHRIRVNELNWQGAKLTIAMIVVAVSTAFGAYIFIMNEARAQTDAGMTPIKARVDIVETEQKALRQELGEVKADVHETQMDIRALYKAQMTGQRQERLEKPPPEHKDGGTR